MATNVMFVKMLLSVLSYYPSGIDVLPWMVLVITIVKVAKKADSILARIGLNPAMTGDPLGRGFPGAMTMMVVRSLVSNAAHTIGRNGGQPRGGSGNPKPSAPTGPRTGGNSPNVNAPSYANGYHHSASAQQSGTNPVSGQESVSAQTASAQNDTVQSAAEKMAGAFPQAAPAGTGKQPNSTRKTAVPPGTRRAPGHVAAPKNNAALSAGKTVPNAPYHHAETVQPGTGGAATQNTQQEQAVHSQSESHPRSSATVQNHGGTVLSGAAGKAAAQNPPRSTNQPTDSAGRSYHSSNAQRQTVQTESAQQRSTFAQPPDAQRSAPNTVAPNATPNNPASPSATPRSPAQPVGSAGMPNHPNGSQVRNTQAESVQQRSTFVQAPNMAGAQQPAAEQPTSSIPPRSGMAGNPSVPHIGVQSTSAPSGTAGKQPDSHSAPARDTAGNGARPQQSGGPQNAPAPGTAGTQRTSIGGRYTQPVQQTTRVSANGTTQITQQNHVSAQQSSGAAQPTSGTRMDGRSTTREHPAPAAPSSNREVGMPPRSTTRPDAARPAEQRASQRPIPAQNGGAEKPISPAAPFPNREAGASPHSTTRPDAARSAEQRASQRPLPAQNGSAEKPTPQTVTHAPSGVLSDRQRRKPAAPVSTGSMTAPTPVSQESRGPQRSPAAEASAKRPAPQERKAGTQSEPQKKEQTLYHRPGTAGIAPTAVGINTEAASAAQKPTSEKTAKKPFVPLTGRTPESIPSHLDLHEAAQKTTRRPQEKQEVTNDE